LRTVLLRHFDMLADYTDADFFRLSSLLEWLSKHPASNLYPRQLPVPGLDSKWLEQRTALVSSLLTALRGEDADAGGQDFYARCGLKAPPVLLRLRVLDQALRQRFGGLCDISAPIEELMRLDLPAKRVLVVENLQSALALPDLLGAVVFTALGKSVSLLASLPWVRATQVHYWGDIDTHGLHILHHARTHLPEVRSILMDEFTLLSHQVLWSEEPTQYGAEDLDMLDAAERWLYRDLKRHRWGYNVRLEQERIDWNAVIRAL
jgi:hypothetical protein